MNIPIVDQILELVQQLPHEQRRQLIARLEQELADERLSEQPPMRPDEARAAWQRLRESMREIPTPRLSAGEQLEADRRSRERTLLGPWTESGDVDA
jgi:hypothetical protein